MGLLRDHRTLRRPELRRVKRLVGCCERLGALGEAGPAPGPLALPGQLPFAGAEHAPWARALLRQRGEGPRGLAGAAVGALDAVALQQPVGVRAAGHAQAAAAGRGGQRHGVLHEPVLGELGQRAAGQARLHGAHHALAVVLQLHGVHGAQQQAGAAGPQGRGQHGEGLERGVAHAALPVGQRRRQGGQQPRQVEVLAGEGEQRRDGQRQHHLAHAGVAVAQQLGAQQQVEHGLRAGRAHQRQEELVVLQADGQLGVAQHGRGRRHQRAQARAAGGGGAQARGQQAQRLQRAQRHPEVGVVQQRAQQPQQPQQAGRRQRRQRRPRRLAQRPLQLLHGAHAAPVVLRVQQPRVQLRRHQPEAQPAAAAAGARGGLPLPRALRRRRAAAARRAAPRLLLPGHAPRRGAARPLPRQPAPRPPPPPPGPSRASIAVSRETGRRRRLRLPGRLSPASGALRLRAPPARARDAGAGRAGSRGARGRGAGRAGSRARLPYGSGSSAGRSAGSAAPGARGALRDATPRRRRRRRRRPCPPSRREEAAEAPPAPGRSRATPMDHPSPTYMIANLTPLHSEQLLQGLNLLRQHHELCDIILRVGDVKIHAHKVVLASISPYFKAMFSGNLSEKENSEVEFQCIAETALQAIVEYAYTGTVFISQDTVESLLPAANLLQIKLVLKECCTFLESQLDPGNCIGISRFAETYGCHDLYLAANKYICRNFEEVCQTEEFFELTHSELEEIVSNDCLNVVTEEMVFCALESWIKYDAQERQKYLAQLLHGVRLPLLSVKFLTRLYEANHLVRDDRTCKHLLNEALKYHFMPEHRLSCQTVLTTRPRCPAKVLCAVGGKAGLFACLESVEMYFPQNDSWIGLAPLSVPRFEFGICVLDQKIYVIGGIATHMYQGINYRKHENSVECWDPDTNTWTSLESMNESRSTLGVAVLAREIYALGGYNGQSYLQSVEKYIPKVKEWQPVAPMSRTRSCFAAAVLDGMIYAIGGYGPAHMNSVERFDPGKDSWETVAPMADKRINFGVGVMLGFIFVVGGHNGVSHLSSIERYDPHQNQWTVCRPMKEPRTGVGAAIIDTYLYVVGGHSGSTYLNTVQKYDPISDSWLDTAGMMYCRCNFGLTAL